MQSGAPPAKSAAGPPTPPPLARATQDDSRLEAIMAPGPPPASAAAPAAARTGANAAQDDVMLQSIMSSPGPGAPAPAPAAQDDARLQRFLASAEPPAGQAAEQRQRSDDSVLVALLGAEQPPAAPRPPVSPAADDALLTSLLTPSQRPAVTILPAAMSMSMSIAADDARLTKLLGPSQVDRDDAALEKELEGGFVGKAAEVLAKIGALREERARRHQAGKDVAVLEEIMGPPPAEPAPPPANYSAWPISIRRVRTLHLATNELQPGSLCYFANIGDSVSVRHLCEQARRAGDAEFVNSRDGHRRTALHHAAYEGSAEVADALLQAGADVELRDAEERTPFHIAAYRGQVDVARLMIGFCIFRIRAAAYRTFREDRLVPNEPWEDPRLAEQRTAHSVLVAHLRTMEDTWKNLFSSEDIHGFSCIHYALRDSYRGCLPVIQLLSSSFCEFAEPGRADEVMSDRRYQPTPASPFVQVLGMLLSGQEVAALRREHSRRWSAARSDLMNQSDHLGLFPLHYAAAEGNYRAVHVLVAAGADVSKEAAVLDPLVTKGQDEAPATRLCSAFDVAKDSTTRQALASYSTQSKLDLKRQAESLANLVRANCEYVNKPHGVMARTPLHAAVFAVAAAGHSAEVSEPDPALASLLQAHPECDPMVHDACGWTALHFACAYGKPAELRLLIRQAQGLHSTLASLRSPGKENEDRRRETRAPRVKVVKERSQAAERWSQEGLSGQLQGNVVDKLKARVRFSRQSRSSGFGTAEHAAKTALMTAAGEVADKGDTSAASLFLGALMGRTPTHVAAQGAGDSQDPSAMAASGQLRCLAILDEEGLLELEALDDKGQSPLLSACASGASAGARWLLERGADAYCNDKMNNSALHLSAMRGHRTCTRLLCWWDSDVSRLKAHQDWKGRTPCELRKAGWSKRTAGLDEILEDFSTLFEGARNGDIDEIQRALRAGAHVNDLSPAGWTAAMHAAATGQIAVLRLLLAMRCSCDPPSPDSHVYRPTLKPARGRSPLHLAAEGGHVEICVLLIQAGGCPLELRSADGLTPLLAACLAGRLPTLQALLVLKADLEATVNPKDRQTSSRGVFHFLVAGKGEHHLVCTNWLSDYLLRENPEKLVRLLENGDKAKDLPRPADLAKPFSSKHQTLVAALREAKTRQQDEMLRAAGW